MHGNILFSVHTGGNACTLSQVIKKLPKIQDFHNFTLEAILNWKVDGQKAESKCATWYIVTQCNVVPILVSVHQLTHSRVVHFHYPHDTSFLHSENTSLYYISFNMICS